MKRSKKSTPQRPTGIVTPMVTPFQPNGQIDTQAVTRIIEHLVSQPDMGILILGTNGEAASMDAGSRRHLVSLAVETVAGRAPLYIGISNNCLADSISAAQDYFQLGARRFIAHPPCYFPLATPNLLAYYRQLADAIPGTLILYNIPATTKISIPLDSIAELSSHPRIAGIKDSENDPSRLEALLRWRDQERPFFACFTGASALGARALALGADGVVPSSGNLFPELWQHLWEQSRDGDAAGALQTQNRLNLVAQVYMQGHNVSQSITALKFIMHQKGLCRPTVLPPLYELDAAGQAVVMDRWSALGF